MTAKINMRLANVMQENGFKIYDAKSVDEQMQMLRDFYDFCVEIAPEFQPKSLVHKNIPEGPRWRRLPNFGAKTFSELCDAIGVSKDQTPKNCFGVWVPAELYRSLEDQAIKGRLMPREK